MIMMDIIIKFKLKEKIRNNKKNKNKKEINT